MNLRVAFEKVGVDPKLQLVPRHFYIGRRQSKIYMQTIRQVFPQILDPTTIDQIWHGLVTIHRAGYSLEDIKWGNIIIEEQTKAPIFLDFERALALESLPPRLARYIRDRDAKKLAWILGRHAISPESYGSLPE
jgi:hypothetical protein